MMMVVRSWVGHEVLVRHLPAGGTRYHKAGLRHHQHHHCHYYLLLPNSLSVCRSKSNSTPETKKFLIVKVSVYVESFNNCEEVLENILAYDKYGHLKEVPPGTYYNHYHVLTLKVLVTTLDALGHF